MRKSLKLRIIIMVTLVTAVFLIVSGLLNYNSARNILEKEIIRAAKESANQHGNMLNAWLEGYEQELQALAQTPAISGMQWSEQLPVLNAVLATHNDLEMMFVADAEGFANATTGQELDLSDRNYLQKAIETGKTQFSEPVISKATGALVTVLAQPIRGEAGSKPIGVVAATITLNRLQAMVEKMTIAGQGNGWNISKDKTTLAHADQKWLGNAQFISGGNGALKEIAERMTQGENATAFNELAGDRNLVAFAPVAVSGWSLALEAPIEAVLKPADVIRTTSFWIIVASIIISMLSSYYMAVYIVKPILKVKGVAEALAEGDLTNHVDSKAQDEIGLLAQAINGAADNLRLLVGRVSQSAEQVAASSQQLSASSEEVGQASSQVADSINQLARGSDQLAKDSHEMSELIEAMTESISEISQGSKAISVDTAQTVKTSGQGRALVEKSVHQITTIKDATSETSKAITSLRNMSKEVGQIVQVITGIADQTNLLALNAAIEAARAGEQGRGFAVVAEEVRKLAEQSRTAAEQIASLIKKTQEQTYRAVQTMETGSAEVQKGIIVIRETGEAFEAINQAIQKIATRIQGITKAAEKLAQNSGAVVGSVESVAATAQESAASSQEISASAQQQNAAVEEIAASAQALSELAEDLQEAIKVFRL